jgi:hypothetical protein
MRMLLLVFRQSLDKDLHEMLEELDVKAFTEAPKVFGIGEAGTAFNSMTWPGSNCMILAAMEDEQATPVVERLVEFRDCLAEKQHHAKVPLRVFSLPCVRLI